MVFVDFVSVEHFITISSRFEQTDRYVRCLSAEKKKGVSIHLHNKHFRHNRISKMLKMSIVHAPAYPFGGSRSPADRQPHMFFWCQTCAKSTMGLQAAIRRL